MAIFDGQEVHIGDTVTLEHPDGSRLIRRVLASSDETDEWCTIDFTGVTKPGNRTFLRWLLAEQKGGSGGGWKLVNVKHGEYAPFAAYVDKYGHDVWVTDGNGNLRCITNSSSNPKKYAPFTQMVVPTSSSLRPSDG